MMAYASSLLPASASLPWVWALCSDYFIEFRWVHFSTIVVIHRVSIFSGGFIGVFLIFLFLVRGTLVFMTEGLVKVFVGYIKEG
jgi:hypothetical protein